MYKFKVTEDFMNKENGNLLIGLFAASLFCLCFGLRGVGFVFAIAILIVYRKDFIEILRSKRTLALYILPLFVVARFLSKTPHQLMYIKIAAATLVYYAAALVFFKRRSTDFSKMLVSLIFIVFFASVVWTAIADPALLIQRKIFEYPFFSMIEWGPSYIYYNLPLIGLTALFLYRREWALVVISQIMVFFSVFWGIRGALIGFALANIAVLISQKKIKRASLVVLVNFSLMGLYSLLNRTVFASEVFQKKFFVDKPSVFRSWESPRVQLLEDVSVPDFWVKNIFGGQLTEFSGIEFKENPHNILIQTYWTSGIVSFLILLVLWIALFIKSKTIDQKVITALFFVSFSLNIYSTWFFILFAIYCSYVFLQDADQPAPVE